MDEHTSLVPSTPTKEQKPAKLDLFERFDNLVELVDWSISEMKDFEQERRYRDRSRYDRRVGDDDVYLAPSREIKERWQGVLERARDADKELKSLWPGEDIFHPSRKHVARRLSMMVGAYPNTTPHSPQVYANMLLLHVAAKHPWAMVLESTCREVVETLKFAPTVAEVLEILKKHQEKWERRTDSWSESYLLTYKQPKVEELIAARQKADREYLCDRAEAKRKWNKEGWPERRHAYADHLEARLKYEKPYSYSYNVNASLIAKLRSVEPVQLSQREVDDLIDWELESAGVYGPDGLAR